MMFEAENNRAKAELNQPDLKIAIVGDVHDQWDENDRDALHALNVDLVLFVGDFGNESVNIVRHVAAVDIPKAIILGNHDAWYSSSRKGQENCPYDRTLEDRLQQQLELLGETHVGYGKLDFPELDLSIVGGRPFSSGGPEWHNRRFYRDRYGIHNITESVAKIVESIESTTCTRRILISHNGPAGLGANPHDLCGKDWEPIGGDHGDPDLQDAIAQTFSGNPLSLVTFGHMHHRLRNRLGDRKRWCVTPETAYLNAACVPRIVKTDTGVQRLFSVVTLQSQTITTAAIVRLDARHQVCDRDDLMMS
jgi:uncharacterized protein (TIGR04168 family)